MGIHVRLKPGRREDWGFESLGRHHARVTELVYVSGSNPGAQGHVSSNLTTRTTYRTGVMGARSALTREDEDRNLGAVPYGSMAKLVKAADCKSVIARSNWAGTSNTQDDVGRR